MASPAGSSDPSHRIEESVVGVGRRREEVLVDLSLERPVAGGTMLARPPDGPIVLVAGGLPGERVKVRIDKRAKKRWEGTVVEVIEASPDRRDPPCPHVAEGCGGCDLQHARPDAQPDLKQAVVADALARLGGVPDAVIRLAPPLPATDHRTTVRGIVTPDGQFGFRARRTHDAVDATGCLVVHPLLRELIDEGRFGAAAEVTLRAGAATGERLAIISPSARDVRLPDDVRVVGDDELRRGKRAWIHETIDGTSFRVSARSFFQARPDGARALVDEVRRLLDGSDPRTLVDAYCGVGLFTVFLGADGRQVFGVERSASSLADARINTSGLTVKLFASSVEAWRPSPADAVIADPSRSGLGHDAVRTLAASRAPTLVLVSCDPAALGRDTKLLANAGYHLRECTVVDLFPHTHHLEVVSRFDRG